MPITALPTPAPSTSDPSTFDARADALFGALPTFVTEANALQTDVNSKQTLATAASVAAAASVSYGSAALASTNYKGVWSSLTGAATVPYCVSYPTNTFWMLTENIANITTEVPGVSSKWLLIGPPASYNCTNIIEDLSYLPPVTFTWNPGSLADGAGETSAAVPYPGATLGGVSVQAIAPYDLQGITCNAWVDAANSCKVRLQNETAGTIDLASGTWTLQARRI